MTRYVIEFDADQKWVAATLLQRLPFALEGHSYQLHRLEPIPTDSKYMATPDKIPDEMTVESLGKGFSWIRKAWGMSVTDISDRCGLSINTIHRFERGEQIVLGNFLRLVHCLPIDAIQHLFDLMRAESLVPEYVKPQRLYDEPFDAHALAASIWGGDKPKPIPIQRPETCNCTVARKCAPCLNRLAEEDQIRLEELRAQFQEIP